MSLGKFISWKISVSDISYMIVENNIFETFFLITFNILLFEFLQDKSKESFEKVLLIALAFLWEIVLPIEVNAVFSKSAAKIILSFLPSPLLCEGSFIFVILGIMFYYLRNNRKRMMIVYLMFSFAFFIF